MVESLDAKEVAKLIRKDLKRKWKKEKFYVTINRYAGGQSIDVEWVDGPTEKEVRELTHQYDGVGFDGMQDLKYYTNNRFKVGGKEYTSYCKVCYKREFNELLDVAIAEMAKYWGFDPNSVEVGTHNYKKQPFKSIQNSFFVKKANEQMSHIILRYAETLSSTSSQKSSQKQTSNNPEVTQPYYEVVDTVAIAHTRENRQYKPWEWGLNAAKPFNQYRGVPKQGIGAIEHLLNERGIEYWRTKDVRIWFPDIPSEEIRTAMKAEAATGEPLFYWNKFEKCWCGPTTKEDGGNCPRLQLAKRIVSGEIVSGEYEQSFPHSQSNADLAKDLAKAEKFRELADGLTSKIEDKFALRQENTPRRQRMAASIRQDGYHLQNLQSALYGLADMWEQGTVPDVMKGINYKTQVNALIKYGEWRYVSSDDEQSLARANINGNNFAQAKESLEGCQGDKQEREKTIALQERLKELESQTFNGVSGFFPTPERIVQMMLDEANIQPDEFVIEPHAGQGHIAEVIRDRHPDAQLLCGEIHLTLRELLELKGFDLLESRDWLKTYYTALIKLPDVIVQNPPWGNAVSSENQDICHIRHSYDIAQRCLVSLANPGIEFRRDRKYEEFRQWLKSVGGQIHHLPDNAFTVQESGTNARAVMVVIHKRSRPTPTKGIDAQEVIHKRSRPTPTKGIDAQEAEEKLLKVLGRVQPQSQQESQQEGMNAQEAAKHLLATLKRIQK